MADEKDKGTSQQGGQNQPRQEQQDRDRNNQQQDDEQNPQRRPGTSQDQDKARKSA
jgi:hypothetical protein